MNNQLMSMKVFFKNNFPNLLSFIINEIGIWIFGLENSTRSY